MKQILSLLLVSAAWLSLGSTAGYAQDGKVIPFEVCQYYSPVDGKVSSVLSYDNSNSRAQGLEPGTLANYFAPGEFDLGQPTIYLVGVDKDFIGASYYLSDSTTHNWILDWWTPPDTSPNAPQPQPPPPGQTVLTTGLGTAPPCVPSYFQPAATLTFSGPGTYTHQLLGQLAYAGGGLTTTVYSAAGANNLSFANMTWTTNPGNSNLGVPSIQQPVQYLYGDVTAGPGSAGTTNLLVQLNDAGGRQVALGTDTVQVSGSTVNTAGCPTDVTKSVQGTMSAPVQLFGTQIWTQLVTIKNTSGVAIPGPIQLALNNLSGNARLFTAAGTGGCPGIVGAPYITITNGLPANANGAVVLTFTNSTVPNAAITYTPVIVAGGSHL